MSEVDESSANAEQPKPQPPQAPDASQAVTDQKPTETVDFWKAKAREQEKRAKENADAVAELAKIKESQKSEAEKAADRLRELESEAASAKQEAARFKVAAKFAISDDFIDFLTGEDEEVLTEQAKKLSKIAEDAGKPRAPKPDPNQGRAATLNASTADQFAAAFNDAFNR